MIAGSLLWALPPPLMCLHFHPMAVSRWFSAASLKQVSNMAITGSGSLAISLCVFVISAAFLPKGKFGFLFFFPLSFQPPLCLAGCRHLSTDEARGVRACVCIWVCVCVCVCVCVWLNQGVGEVVRCVVRAGCAHRQGAWENLSITFSIALGISAMVLWASRLFVDLCGDVFFFFFLLPADWWGVFLT